MRVDIPVFGHSGGKLQYGNGDAKLLDKTGNITWSYHGKDHKGIGIVACARSATMYITYLLRAMDYSVGHEQWGPDGSVGYHLVAVRPDNCFHQVRHPLKQIASMWSHRSWGFADQVVDLPDLELYGCMQYWLMWNELCEEFCVWRYQIEQLPTVWDEFLERIGHDSCEMPDVPTTTNTQNKYGNLKKVTWADLFIKDDKLAQKIVDKAVEYGYESPVKDKDFYQNLRELETAEVASV